MRWEKIHVKINGEDGKGPGKRWGHTCNTINGGRFIYVFGGYGGNNSQTNKVYVFDTLNQSWSQPEIKGYPPIPRDSHTCTNIGDNLFVFGGTNGVNPLKDLHILYTSSHTWITPTIRGEGPEAREGHSAAAVGQCLFIFGGCGKSADNDSEVYYNDLYILNTETLVWTRATTSGAPPSPRDSHSCSSWKNKIIVIGGEDRHDYYLSDVHIFDTDTLIWRELITTGQLLPPRAGHSTVSFGKNLFVFGGFTYAQNLYNDLYMLDIDTGVWTNIKTTIYRPCARFSLAGDCVDPIKSGVLVFIGGCNKSLEGLDDMFYLYTGMARESGQTPANLSLRKQLKLKCQEQHLNPAQNQVLPMPRLNYPVNQFLAPPGKKVFVAKVAKKISGGYTLETIIDGKPLRGVMFHNKPSSLHSSDLTSTRKRAAGEVGTMIPNGAHTDRSKTPKLSECHEHHHTEAVAALVSCNPTTSDASIIHKISANREPEASSSNQIDGEKYETPKSSGGNLKNDGANDVASSASEVPANDQTNVPILNSEVPMHDNNNDAPNCTTTESAACLSNQDELVGAMMDCTARRAEEISESRKAEESSEAPRAEESSEAPRAEESSEAPRAEESSEAPRAEESSAAPRAEESSAAPRAEESSAAPRAEESSAAPMAEESSAAPMAEESSAAPMAEESSAAPMAEESSAAPMAEESSAAPRAEESSAAPMAEESSAAPMAEESSAAPMAEESSAAPMAEESSEAPMAEESSEAPRAEESSEAPRAEESSEAPRAEESSEAPRAEESSAAPMAEESNAAPMAEESSEAPRAEESSATPMAEESNAAPRAQERSEAPRAEESSEAPRAEESSEAPRAEESSAAPMAEESSAAPMAEESSAAPMAQESSAAPMAEESSAAPMAEESSEAPRAEENSAAHSAAHGAAPRAEESSEAPRAEESSEAPRAEESSEAPRAEESSEAPRAEESSEAPRAEESSKIDLNS
ncbi:unnamed protein product [Lupinus luteus]|uniref:Uncharacterized protein n=1 Tax=Lupinus luteus TaxID=3873 RepID=A0AAV1WD00_LUPLU